ncbi:hypothetical protein [Photobacterium carnosum]|uniref:hypothetical protein n=1 Tax=Photobacterium carnosum TaxID=2023717 RepID=UPI001E52236D|nr:hypothetical protein [Photobacterium carnosum]MCD9500366.1 hypothetical protein [Photobacterium carnosum]
MKSFIFLFLLIPFFAQAHSANSIVDCAKFLPKGSYDIPIQLHIESPKELNKNHISFGVTDGSKTLNKEMVKKLWPFTQCISPLISGEKATLDEK